MDATRGRLGHRATFDPISTRPDRACRNNQIDRLPIVSVTGSRCRAVYRASCRSRSASRDVLQRVPTCLCARCPTRVHSAAGPSSGPRPPETGPAIRVVLRSGVAGALVPEEVNDPELLARCTAPERDAGLRRRSTGVIPLCWRPNRFIPWSEPPSNPDHDTEVRNARVAGLFSLNRLVPNHFRRPNSANRFRTGAPRPIMR